MKAIILAAGQSIRLRPITNNTPKCLLKINKKTILAYQIDKLIKNNIREIIIVVGFKQKQIIKYLNKNYPNIKFIFIKNNQFKTTSAAYSLYLAKKYLNDDVIYLNADALFEENILKKVLKDKRSNTAIQRVEWDEEEVNVIVNNELNILEIGKHISKKLNYGEFIGVTKINKSFNQELIKVLDNFVKNKKLKKFAADAINLTIQRNQKMYAINVTKFKAIEIDTPEDYKKAQKLWLS